MRDFERREQTILFINRRGYSSSMLCTKCGHAEECRHCSITMTYHRSDETIRCHLCGDSRPAPSRCPKCGAPDIRWKGLGTQRVEESVRRVLPKARIERIDADTMAKKNRFRELLGEFRTGKIDVLVGTQMIGKGLDFPNVTLVGLVDADISMHIPDFRANERTFQLLGPGGGSRRPGRSRGRGGGADLHASVGDDPVFAPRRLRGVRGIGVTHAAAISLSAVPAFDPPPLSRPQRREAQILRRAMGPAGGKDVWRSS
jgi:primosomal protein N' (replication factor Y)